MILILKLAKTLTQVQLNIFRKIDENRQNKEMRSTNNNQLGKEEHRVSENKNSLIKIYRCIISSPCDSEPPDPGTAHPQPGYERGH